MFTGIAPRRRSPLRSAASPQQPVVMPPAIVHDARSGRASGPRSRTPCSTCCRCSACYGPRAAVRTPCAGQATGRRRRWCSVCSVALLVFVGIVANALLPRRRPRAAGTVFEEGAWLFVVYGAVLAASAPSPTGARSCGAGASPDKAVAAARRCSGALGDRAGRGAVPHRRVRRPAGRAPYGAEFDYSGPQDLWNGLVARRPRADAASPCSASSASRSRSFTSGRSRAATTRGTARRSSGRRRRRRPTTTSPRCTRARRPNRCSTSSPRPEGRLMLALPAAPPRRRVGSCSSAPRWPAPPRHRSSAACWRCGCASARGRSSTGDRRPWVPKGIKIPQVPANVMLLTFVPICVFAQWAVYAATPRRPGHTGLALGLIGLLGLAVDQRPGVHLRADGPAVADERPYSTHVLRDHRHVHALLAIVGVVFSAVTAFRFLGGRTARPRGRVGACPVSGTSSTRRLLGAVVRGLRDEVDGERDVHHRFETVPRGHRLVDRRRRRRSASATGGPTGGSA